MSLALIKTVTDMPTKRSCLPVLVGALMVISAAPLSLGDSLVKFSDGSLEALMVFPDGGGNNSSLSIDIPRAVEIGNASIDIEGRPALYGPKTVIIDFQAPAGSRAWAGTTGNVPPGSQPSSYEDTDITLVPGIKSSDDVRYRTSGVNVAPYHMFEFFVGNGTLAGFNVTWEGIGFSDPQAGFGNNGASLYLWNNDTQGWDFIVENGFGEVPEEVTDKAQITSNAMAYIDAGGSINAFVHPANLNQNRIETDYVKLDYGGYRTVSPENVLLDVGADGSAEWSHPGQLNGKQTFSGTAFFGALQKIINASASGTVHIPLKLSAGAGGMLYISNLSIDYGPRDMPPLLKKDLPTELFVPEDGSSLGVVELGDYFEDDGGLGNLSFNLVWLNNTGKVRAVINGTRLDLVANLTDWYGDIAARLRATDARGQAVESNSFTIEVYPVNDAPRLEAVGELDAVQGVFFEHLFNATDPDDSELVLSSNSTLFEIDASSGRAAFLPLNKDVGAHRFWVKAMDDEGAFDMLNVTLVVANRNDRPVMQNIEDATATEGRPMILKVKAADPDGDIGLDRLHFTVNTTMFNISDEGLISFTPQEKDVGVHPIKVTVTDTGGLSDTRNFTLTVLNVNDPPVLARLADMTVYEHQPVSFRVDATDPDSGDRLTFKSNTPLFVISKDGWVNFTPGQKDVGTWTVYLNATDAGGLADSMTFNMTVINVNDPPANVRILSPANGTVYNDGQKMALEANATDDDGDALTYTWFADGLRIGEGKALSAKGLKPGKHSLKVEVSDGTGSNTSAPVQITVRHVDGKSGFIPGFEAVFSALAAAAALALLAVRRRRGPPHID